MRANKTAGAKPTITITPEMLAAGQEALYAVWVDRVVEMGDEDLVAVYTAMASLAPQRRQNVHGKRRDG